MKKKIFDNIIQLIIVIVGVFIGMVATEWRSYYKEQKFKKEMLLSIKAEIETNLNFGSVKF